MRTTVVTLVLAMTLAATAGDAQEARRRWELQRQIRLDKFEQVLPVAMKNAGLDAWIVAVKENHYDPLWEDLGRGYVTGLGYYAFFLRGERVERLALGPSGYLLNQSGAYDKYGSADDLAKEVRARDPKRIGVNMSEEIGPADGLSVTMHAQLVKTLGEPYASRLASAERLVSEFRSRRVAAEIVAFGEAAGIAIQLAERALSNEVITPGKTTLEEAAWWLQDRLLERGLGSEFDMPSVYVTGPEGIVATSNDRIVQPGDVIMIDWGVKLMNFGTDVKRVAYVLKPGETTPPASIRNAFDRGDRRPRRHQAGDQGRPHRQGDDGGDGRGIESRGLRRDRVQQAESRRQDRHHLRLPPGGQHRPRHRPLAHHLAAAAEHLHPAPAAPVLVRVLRLYAVAGMGRQETAHPDRGRRDADGTRDSVRAPGELSAAGDQMSSRSWGVGAGVPATCDVPLRRSPHGGDARPGLQDTADALLVCISASP